MNEQNPAVLEDDRAETYIVIEGDRIDVDPEFQGVTLWIGDGLPINVDDQMTEFYLRGYLTSPLQRAVTRARLLVLADMLDDGLTDPRHADAT